MVVLLVIHIFSKETKGTDQNDLFLNLQENQNKPKTILGIDRQAHAIPVKKSKQHLRNITCTTYFLHWASVLKLTPFLHIKIDQYIPAENIMAIRDVIVALADSISSTKPNLPYQDYN